jgi:hypothetical protein
MKNTYNKAVRPYACRVSLKKANFASVGIYSNKKYKPKSEGIKHQTICRELTSSSAMGESQMKFKAVAMVS